MYILAVLELEENRETPVVAQQNGDLNLDERTQMTSFEIDLKDKRFVAAVIKPPSSSACTSLLLYICQTLYDPTKLLSRYQDDFRPLVEGCGCYCCKNHQRAYLHHLLVTNELLAGVLLMIHNTAHYLGFFRALREALAGDKLDLLKRRVLREGGRQTERKD